MYEYIKKNKRFCEDGVELLRFRASYPCFEKCGEINDFYETLTEYCLNYCDTVLFPKMRQAYADDPDEKKRFIFYKYTYEINAKVLNVTDGVASVRADVRLYGKKLDKKATVMAHNFSICDGKLLCPLTAAKKLAPGMPSREVKKLLSVSENLLFSDKEIFCLRKGNCLSAEEAFHGKNKVKTIQKSSKTVVND